MKKYYIHICLVIFYTLGLVMGFVLGTQWSFHHYQPLKLIQQNQELKADVKLCNSAWVRQFSREHKLIEE